MLGRTVSHYEVTQWLGAGAMGEVYAARDTLLGRTVAVKVLAPGGEATEEHRLRFLHEARAASALNHPNIVTIHDVLRDGDDDCIVMELIAGETLAARIERGPVGVEQTLDIIDCIADALATAHAVGIVHRDLKPHNVMFTKSGLVKILDFGLAKRTALFEHDATSATVPRTQSGVIVGTPSYMSPEQVLGQPLDGRSDIFSLGTIAAEMLTGTNPFEAGSVIATMHQIAYGEPPDLTGVPGGMRDLVERMLAKKKEERFQSADELRAAIVAVRDGRPFARPRPHGVKRKIMTAAAAVLALAVLAGGTYAWRTRPVPTDPAQEAFAAPQTAHEHVQRGNDLMSTYWRKGYVDKAIEEFQRAIAIDGQHAAAHAGLATAYWRRYDKGKDKAWLDLALKNARHSVELDPQLGSAHIALAVAELGNGNTDVARKELEQTLVLDPANVAAHRWLGEIASRGKDTPTAEAELRKALALQPRDPDLHNVLGWVFYNSARYPQAVSEYRQVIALAPDYVAAHRNLGASLHMLGDYAGAARAIQQSLEIEPNANGYSNLGTLYFFQGLYPQSVSAFEKAVQLGANDHLLWANLGDAYRWTPGNQDKAREAFTTALHLLTDEIRKKPDDATLQSRRALYLAKQGRAPDALAAADALMARKEDNPQILYRLALAYELAGARGKSLTALEQAVRKGYSTEEIETDPELAALRRDVQYQQMRVRVR